MKTFAITTLGCKVNQYESQQIRHLLESLGLRQSVPGQSPELIIVNSCAVTHIASAKSRQQIRKRRRLNPRATIVLAGCLPAAETDELGQPADDVHIVRQKSSLPSFLTALIKTSYTTTTGAPSAAPATAQQSSRAEKGPEIKHKKKPLCPAEHVELPPISVFTGQKRAFLKVQDGCDGYCSYCIIPKIRTNVCNKPVKSVMDEASALVDAGHKEIVLTGIFLGAFGQSTVRRKRWDPTKLDALADLLDGVARTPGLRRVRLSSLEPADVTDRLLDVFCDHQDVIMPHLHLPLQSAGPEVLRRMCRQYTIDQFLGTVEKLHRRLDQPAITTDIIVGFPGETDDDFDATLDIACRVGFAKMHVFSFSIRKNTAAAAMTPKIPPGTIANRSRQLRELNIKLQADFRRRCIGQKVSAVIESETPPAGRTERYFMVSDDDLDGAQIHDGILTGILAR